MLSDNRITFTNPSISSSWSSILYNILKHPPYSLAPQASNRPGLRHCSGNIWKHLISVSIYHDLASISATDRDNPTSTTRTTRRRFVRLEHIGLSGVILYEIRMCSPCRFSQGDSTDLKKCLTMQGVFGDPESSDVAADHSMDLDDLLDAVDAKVIHFPVYACTSFIVGQLMNAYLTNRPELTPIPAPSGFSISGSEPPSVICSAASFTPDICSDGKISIDGAPTQLLPHLDDFQEAFSLITDSEDDPYLALCVRTSSLGSSGVRLSGSASKYSDPGEEEAGYVGDSTIDSLGPCTPPRLSYGLIPSGKRNTASKDPLDFVSAGLLHSTEENELASFIDFTGSFFEDIDLAMSNDRPV
ncbi:hypothetical protein BYT27DRAFT_7185046 [Phlegmacium glaucopus]|nr:hypothetical protein BYT27DRAFT_7185046 [Phlegmacium glaucopus]